MDNNAHMTRERLHIIFDQNEEKKNDSKPFFPNSGETYNDIITELLTEVEFVWSGERNLFHILVKDIMNRPEYWLTPEAGRLRDAMQLVLDGHVAKVLEEHGIKTSFERFDKKVNEITKVHS